MMKTNSRVLGIVQSLEVEDERQRETRRLSVSGDRERSVVILKGELGGS